MYLEGIYVSEHNAIEHYVHQQVNAAHLLLWQWDRFQIALYLQINREDKNTGYFPLFQARSLQEKKDDALTELAELKTLMSVILEHHQEEVHK